MTLIHTMNSTTVSKGVTMNASDYAALIDSNRNPVVPFELTYSVRDILDSMGYFTESQTVIKSNSLITGYRERKVTVRVAAKTFRYRVDHGGFHTQNTWKTGQCNPDVLSLTDPVKTQGSLLNLREELWERKSRGSISIDEMIMKINSCLKSEYPHN